MTERHVTERTLVGEVLASRYEIRALLGRGGMGEVYEAADHHLDRTVAVKVLRPELAADRRFLARFRREARTAARLGHPGIVAVHDIAESGGRAFIVMELVPGATLGDLVARGGAMDPGAAARLVADAAEALAHAHDRGVVHRDVSPGNVMVTDAGSVKILDFGIARAVRGSGATRSGSDALGTLAYVAPEQADADGGDQRVDVYALGAVLYELLSGRPPFEGGSTREVADLVRRELPAPVRSIRPNVPEALNEVVARCLAKDPSTRYPTADRLANALRAAVDDVAAEPIMVAARSGDAITVPIPRVGDATAELPPARPTSRLAPTAATPVDGRRRPGRVIAWLAVAAMAFGALWVAGPSLAGLGGTVAPTVKGPKPLPVPSGVVATASCDGFLSTGVDVAWTPGGPSGGYEIFRRGASEDAFTLIARIDDWHTTSFRDIDLGVDTGYAYRVRTVKGPRVGRFGPVAEADTPLLCLT
ncbi:MAG: protein kinase domain-containing protein [Actinomycetota bacterium]